MTRNDLVMEALRHAEKLGVRILPGPVFDWVGSDAELPTSCNWVGAILLQLGYRRSNNIPWTEADRYLKENSESGGAHWFYRFHQGFDGGHQLLIRESKGSKKKIKKKDIFLKFFKKDKVSEDGIRIRKLFCKGTLWIK